MDELDSLPALLEDIRRQRGVDYSVFVCVNQPDTWTSDDDMEHRRVSLSNIALLETLRRFYPEVQVMDRATPGRGMGEKEKGVGWARKCLFDSIVAMSGADEIIVSLDADTRISDNYLRRLLDTFCLHPDISALAVPYYHKLDVDEKKDRTLLRYECYMRHYLIEMMRIASPYAFTAIGSAMAFTARAYKRVGGMTPLQAGEDFYLMQKFAKKGHVHQWLEGCDSPDMVDQIAVFPSGRCSTRVPFGTGPSVSMPLAVQAERYPFYASRLFDMVGDTYKLFPCLYEKDMETPMSDFLRRQLATDDIWGPMRNNFKKKELFIHACHERVDGLRILQFLKSRYVPESLPEGMPDFCTAPVEVLNRFRDELVRKEMSLRKQYLCRSVVVIQ